MSITVTFETTGAPQKIVHPFKILRCDACDKDWWLHDERRPEVRVCPTCDRPLTRIKRWTKALKLRRFEYLMPTGSSKTQCITCGRRSTKKTITANGGNCRDCGPYKSFWG